jgi:hypothetical protein
MTDPPSARRRRRPWSPGALERLKLPKRLVTGLEAATALHYTEYGLERIREKGGGDRARSRCCFAPLLIHFTPDSLTFSVRYFLSATAPPTGCRHSGRSVSSGQATITHWRWRTSKVRKTPSRPRSWANFSLLSLFSHRNACWANLHLLGQPNTLLAQAGLPDAGFPLMQGNLVHDMF